MPERLSPEDSDLSLRELCAQMKRFEVLLVFKQLVTGLKLAVNPGFLIPKTDDLGLTRNFYKPTLIKVGLVYIFLASNFSAKCISDQFIAK